MGNDPLAITNAIAAPRVPWPRVSSSDYRPLAGIRILDFSRAVAAPIISKMLAILGADVIRISGPHLPDHVTILVDLSTGKRDVSIDLRSTEGQAKIWSLIKDADVLVDGFRPGVLKKHGIDGVSLRKVNPSIIYVRECCYGYSGPWAHRSGWQQVSDALTGLAWLQGRFLGLDEPVCPLLRKS